MIALQPIQELYQYDEDVFKEIIQLVVAGWRSAEENGVELPGQGLVFPCILGNKGDWSYLVTSANLCRSYRRAPKGAREAKTHKDNPPGICHLCMCGTREGSWEDLNVAERLIKEARCSAIPSPWDEEPAWAQLWHEESPGGLERFHRIDIWHAFHLGVGKSWVASCVGLAQHLVRESSVDKRLSVLNEHWDTYCTAFGKTKYLRRLDPWTFGLKGKEPSAGWNKAHVTATLMQWLQHFLEEHRQTCERDPTLRFVAP
ncbi:unnamed protein product [Durusdinium trenchii]|uniref:Uncharacterized protein n=1 Tax=Durusdinium trenchii TaxID=1381693 RepID=A0ABP0RDQ6_9DINO